MSNQEKISAPEEPLRQWSKDLVAQERGQSGKEFLFEDIYELKEPFGKILEQMRPGIEEGTYSLIVGDDASGRIPALVMHGFLRRIYQRDNRPIPNTIFVVGHKPQEYMDSPGLLTELMHKLEKHQQPGTALVVTEAIASGDTVQPFIDTLQFLHMPVEVLSVGVIDPTDTARTLSAEELQQFHDRLQNRFQVPLYVGMGRTPQIYRSHILTGVIGESDSLQSKRLPIHERTPDPEAAKKIMAGMLAETRKDVAILVDQLVDQYDGI